MKKQNGFTLVELLAVIVILGILLTFVSVNVIKNIKSSKEDVGEFTLSQVKDAAKTFALSEEADTYCETPGNCITKTSGRIITINNSNISNTIEKFYPEMGNKCTYSRETTIVIEENENDIKVTTKNITCKE